MPLSRDTYYEGRVFKVGELAEAIRTSLDGLVRDIDGILFSLSEQFPDATLRHGVRLEQLTTLCDLRKIDTLSFTCSTIKGARAHDLNIQLRGPETTKGFFIDLYTNVDDINLDGLVCEFRTQLEQALSLVVVERTRVFPHEETLEGKIEELQSRVKSMEERLAADERLQCFLSYPFDVTAHALCDRIAHGP